MKKIIPTLACALMVLGLTGCLDRTDSPDVSDYIITSPTGVGQTNSTIYQLKQDYAEYMAAESGGTDFVKVDTSLVIEGVVVANDAGGNLYQTLVIRDLGGGEAGGEKDQCIQIGVKNTWIAPYFPLGQRIKINLQGLYVGNYSQVPKIGTPYYTSAGNRKLGPMLLQSCRTNVELLGKPDPKAPELTPINLTTAEGISWLEKGSNQSHMTTPRLITVKGYIAEVLGSQLRIPLTGSNSGDPEPYREAVIDPATGKQKVDPATGQPVYNYYKLFAPEELYDDGYGVNRTLLAESEGQSGRAVQIALRTGTQNEISFMRIPLEESTYTGVLTKYGSDWQMQLRSKDDVRPVGNGNSK